MDDTSDKFLSAENNKRNHVRFEESTSGFRSIIKTIQVSDLIEVYNDEDKSTTCKKY